MTHYIGIGAPYNIKPHSYDELDDVIAFLKDLDDIEIVDIIEITSPLKPETNYAEIIFKCPYLEQLMKISDVFEVYEDPTLDLVVDEGQFNKSWSK